MTATVFTRPVAVPATALAPGDRFLADRVIDDTPAPDKAGDLIVETTRIEPFEDLAMAVELDTGRVFVVDGIVWARIASAPEPCPCGDRECDPVGKRATYLQLSDVRLLDMWGHELRAMFNHTAYLVGSSLVRPDYRDVDVRVIVADEVVDQLAAVVDLGRLHAALSIWGAHVTGLPIDCQVQAATEGQTEDGPIRPIGRIPGRLDGRSWPTDDGDGPS